MRILVSNDDGIFAPGIRALVRNLRREHEVSVIAPESEMSAVGHAITISNPLKVKKVFDEGEFFGYAVSGTPADCVKLGLKAILDFEPDLLISGINQGGNYARNIIYSGTVSAATEGMIFGLKSFAISLNSFKDPDFEPAAIFACKMVEKLSKIDLAPGVFLNINYPAVPESKIAGVKVTKQGTSRFVEEFEKRQDPRGNDYYWMAGEMETGEHDIDTDYHYIKENYITITPIASDLTDYRTLRSGVLDSLGGG